CCFFLVLLPPPPASPLFPYTTLFRSSVTLLPDFYPRSPRGERLIDSDGHYTTRWISIHAPREGSDLPGLDLPAEGDHKFLSTLPDRKSTRLNSSHVSISYAVFCLKKK